MIDVNLKAVSFAANAFARGTGGATANVASLLFLQGGIRVPSCTASKHGVAGLTKPLANQWSSKGVNVNAIALDVTPCFPSGLRRNPD